MNGKCDNGKYNKIMNMERPVSVSRAHLSRESRAAQFSPFAALNGYSDAIEETARPTFAKAGSDEQSLILLNRKIMFLNDNLHLKPVVTVSYFKADSLKPGGGYVTVTGRIKRIDFVNRVIFLADCDEIPLDDIRTVECDLFGDVLAE